jgi:beta-lactamase superfamily II metal-dependent hydrolase
MSSVHFLNVGRGDSTLIHHESGHNSLIDICKGNLVAEEKVAVSAVDQLVHNFLEETEAAKGNFGMAKRPTNPIDYLDKLGINDLFRLIITHPDMDHLDGFDALMDNFNILNFWDAGIRRKKPTFAEDGPYKAEDWDRYESAISGKEVGLNVLVKRAGNRFQFANLGEDKRGGGDGLYILAPDKALVDSANEEGDVNDASYVLLYRSPGGRILIPGDAHDETWDYVIEHYKSDVENCSVLFAPHHGRKSGRDFKFLDVVKPKVTCFGCASSGHLAYNAWSSRELSVITNNQAGNIVLDCAGGEIRIYVENTKFARASGCDCDIKNGKGYVCYGSIAETKEAKT